MFWRTNSSSPSIGYSGRLCGVIRTYARRRGRRLKAAGDRDGSDSGSSEIIADNNLPWTARTGLRAGVPPDSVGPPSFEVRKLAKLLMTGSRSLLGVVRRVDRKSQKISGVSPL